MPGFCLASHRLSKKRTSSHPPKTCQEESRFLLCMRQRRVASPPSPNQASLSTFGVDKKTYVLVKLVYVIKDDQRMSIIESTVKHLQESTSALPLCTHRARLGVCCGNTCLLVIASTQLQTIHTLAVLSSCGAWVGYTAGGGVSCSALRLASRGGVRWAAVDSAPP